MFKSILLCFLFLANGAIASNQFADFFNHLESLNANFIQQTYSNANVLIHTASGSLTFKRPKQLRWHVKNPEEQILLLNDNELWLIDIELEQASLQKIKNISKTPLHWLINKPDTLKNIPLFSHTEKGINWYTTGQNNTLQFGFEDDLLKVVSKQNKLGQRILILFSKIVINPNIEAEVFELNIGDNFDVIR